ncbi:MAG: tRNA (adenosine(37)-N6)-threonylcarbamoyltransferase complex transferase subunit TsaD, partial [Bdellovibrionales bacterium]|nr:tRNA (adenosine(37)-N6)-threonylcarbamoyltransferase complex transferase subunit TsaD [Bdellovibrionales bacterium]
AKGLALAGSLPLLGVNHLEGHVFASGIVNELPEFPFLVLVVSGGHTEIQIVRSFSDYELLARTIDDAAGEAFDKSAQLLGFEYPGGAALSAFASKVESSPFQLPKVMREAEGFSFSGLKTAIALLVRKNSDPDDLKRAELCFAIEHSIVESLVFKLKKAMKVTGIHRVVLTGGVAANGLLRSEIQKLRGVELTVPPKEYCTDNGAMIAYIAARRFLAASATDSPNTVFARWPLETLTR